MKWINYHHLIYFKEIAKHLSISKASLVLNVGQPALSTQLKSLEEYLGVQLFERKNRTLFLTEPGKVVLEYAQKIDELGQELLEVIDDKVFSKRIHLSVGALDSIPKHLICDIVDFAHKQTGCFLTILEDSIDSLLRQLGSHQIDVLVSDHALDGLKNKNQNIFSKLIYKDHICAYASKEYKSKAKNFPKSIDKTPCILPTTHSKLRSDIEQYFHDNDIKPLIIAETQDTAVQKILATKGDGIIFLPEYTARELVESKQLVKLGDLDHTYIEYFLIYSKRIIDNPAIKLVLEQDFEEMRRG